ncbi:hypothetical protein HDV00_006514, partial [Rhizophlyctis rosea]
MASVDFETASVHSDTASDFSEVSTTPSHQQHGGQGSTTHPAPLRSHLFTCLACHVAFHSADQQRDHMRTDWHRYNLKRKVADLPPVSIDVFVEKLQAQQVKKQDDTSKAQFVAECQACGKAYSSENAYTNHLASKKHKEAQAKFDARGSRPTTSGKKTTPVVSSPAPQPSSTSSSSSSSSSNPPPAPTDKSWKHQIASATTKEEMEAILERKMESAIRLEETDCLFCSKRSDTFEANMEHMAKGHSFFIPDIEYLVDLKGLIKYLGEKVAVANVCLYCNGKGRAMHTLEAVRKHMLDKGHCKILYEGGAELEVADFYDFSSTYPDEVAPTSEDADEEMVDGDEAEGGDWEDVEGDEDDEDLGDMSRAPGAVHITPDETQLILPSGARIGHRQYRRFWNQSLRTEDNRDSVLIHRIQSQYALLGYEKTPYEVAVAHHKRRMQAKRQLEVRKEFNAR